MLGNSNIYTMEHFNNIELQARLGRMVKGYHLINNSPIKEAIWEGVLSSSLASVGIEHSWNTGSHNSGKDITFKDNKAVSCKSCKIQKGSVDISSYRMTKCKCINDFIHEIDIVRANFDAYAIIAREEKKDSYTYSIYSIPSSKVKAGNLQWSVKHNAKGNISKWYSNTVDGVSMTITPSMSNQLWIKLDMSIMKEYQIGHSIEVSNRPTLDYSALLDKFSLD
jgi:hypothetical protein